MNSKLVLSLVALCVCLLSGSDFAFGQKLYPVQGPLTARRRPSRYFPARSGGPCFRRDLCSCY